MHTLPKRRVPSVKHGSEQVVQQPRDVLRQSGLGYPGRADIVRNPGILDRASSNIRELNNVVERAVILSKSNRARLDLAMPRASGDAQIIAGGSGEQAGFVADAQIKTREKANMIAALRHANWRICGSEGAAELLGLKPSTLAYRMKVRGIRRDE